MDEIRAQMKKDIENEIKMKTRQEPLKEIQVADDRIQQIHVDQELRKKESNKDSSTLYKKRNLLYAITIIIILIMVFTVIFASH